MIYTVFSTSDSAEMQWQSELLEFSWKEVAQPGELIRLVATTSDSVPRHRYARSVRTQPWQVHPLTGDDYAPYNKPASLVEWLQAERPEGTVLLLDPDCVFRAPIHREVAEGHPVAQRWVGLEHSEDIPDFGLDRRFAVLARHGVRPRIRAQLGMIPTLIHTRDLTRIAARWLELTALVRQEVADRQGRRMWESDMYAYAIVAAEAGLAHELTSLGICTNWSPAEALQAPLIHYCQPILSRDGKRLWSKHHYTPWTRVADPALAAHDYGRDLLHLVNRCATAHAAPGIENVRPRPRVGVCEVARGPLLTLRLPGTNREFTLNPAAERLWHLCDGSRTVAVVRETLRREFDDDDLDAVLLDALGTLEAAGLIVFERG